MPKDQTKLTSFFFGSAPNPERVATDAGGSTSSTEPGGAGNKRVVGDDAALTADRPVGSDKRTRTTSAASGVRTFFYGVDRRHDLTSFNTCEHLVRPDTTHLVVTFRCSNLREWDAKEGKGATLDLRKLPSLTSLTIKDVGGSARFKAPGEDPGKSGRVELLLPEGTGPTGIKFLWKARGGGIGGSDSEEKSSAEFEGLTTRLRDELAADRARSVEEWIKGPGNIKTRITAQDMEEGKLLARVQRIKKLRLGEFAPSVGMMEKIGIEPAAAEATNALRARDMVLVFLSARSDGSAEFCVMEVADARIGPAAAYTTNKPTIDPNSCAEDCPDTWVEAWKRQKPAEFELWDGSYLNCFASPDSVQVTPVPRTLIFATLPPSFPGNVTVSTKVVLGHPFCPRTRLVLLVNPISSSSDDVASSDGFVSCPVPGCGRRLKSLNGLHSHMMALANRANRFPLDAAHKLYVEQKPSLKHGLSREHMRDVSFGDTEWKTQVRLLAEGKPASSPCLRPKTMLEYEDCIKEECAAFQRREMEAQQEKKVREAERLRQERHGKIRKQVEYYLSDENLCHDDFYRGKIDGGQDGWFKLDHIMTAPKINMLCVGIVEVVRSLSTSRSVETKKSADGKHWIRRQGGRALPKRRTYNSFRRNSSLRRRFGTEYDSDDLGGCMGYSSYEVEALLEQGIKPWDDDADTALGFLFGGY